ncbi:MAG: hypothetical protein ACLUKN_10550 [Bacilli bacterium]
MPRIKIWQMRAKNFDGKPPLKTQFSKNLELLPLFATCAFYRIPSEETA